MNNQDITKVLEDISNTFILSTGRTGTMFLSDYFTLSGPKVLSLHEPPPSRMFIPLTNMLYAGKMSEQKYVEIYLKRRKQVLHELKNHSHYIESNNFIWAGAKAFLNCIPNTKIIHVIRHPQLYVLSHLNFGFWKFPKNLIRKFDAYMLKHGTHSIDRNNPIAHLFCRWIIINTFLSELDDDQRYVRLKFEEVTDSNKQANQLNDLSDFLNLERYSYDANKSKKLRTNKSDTLYQIEAIEETMSRYIDKLKPLMHKYNYQFIDA